MGASKGTRYPDNELDAALHPIRETSSDPFVGDDLKQTDGWNVMRFVDIGHINDVGARAWMREKEWNFRPKFGGFVIDQVNYRHFAESIKQPLLSSDSEPMHDTVTSDLNDDSTASEQSLSWDVPSDTVGFEMSIVSDFYDPHKASPGWAPSSMDGLNRSSLVISRRPLADDDKNFDFPRRYFSRINDLMVPQPTQSIALRRNRFGSGIGSYEAENANDEFYPDGLWKTCLNVTAFDRPLKRDLRQRNEHDDGPGSEGYTAHLYVPGYLKDEGGMQGKDKPSTESYFQGGWMYEGRLDFLGQLNDVIGIDARECEDAELPRWRNSFGQPVGIPYLRHDAHFQKSGDDKCVPAGKRMSGRIYFTEPVQCPNVRGNTPTAGFASTPAQGPSVATESAKKKEAAATSTPICGEMVFDINLKDHETRIGHECGEWRPMIMSTGPGGGGSDITSFSWHHNPGSYSGSGGGASGAPAPTPGKYDGTKPPSNTNRPPMPPPPPHTPGQLWEFGTHIWDSIGNKWVWVPNPERP